MRVPDKELLQKMMELDQAYENYLKERSPQNLRPVVDALRPTIEYSLKSLNAYDDPHIRNMAMVYTAKAIDRYDPERGSGLKTWVTHQLQPLRRLGKQSRQVLHVPEKIQLDSMTAEIARKEFFDKHDRDPNIGELADASKLSKERLKRINEYNTKIGVNAEEFNDPIKYESDFSEEAMDYVYEESDHIDRKIMEHRLGYGGVKTLPGPKLIQTLGLTPSQLSRRSSRIANKLLTMEAGLKKVV